MKIYTLTAMPACGKTSAVLGTVYELGQKAIIASISKQLSRQSYEYFIRLGGHAAIVDTDNRRGSKSVNDAIAKAAEYADVIFITHAGLMRMSEFDTFKDFHLYIDEVPELVSFNRFSFTSGFEHVKKFCDIKDGLMTIKEETRDELTELASDGYKGLDDIHASLFPLYKTLLSGIPARIMSNEKQTYCYFIDDQSTEEWSKFQSVTVCSANFEQTITGKVLKHFNGWEFLESPLNEKLLFKTYPNTSRITINVMADGEWSKYTANKEHDGITNYTRIHNIIDGVLDGQDFIYTRNSYRTKFSSGVEVSYNPHGLNTYSNHTNVVVMFSYNPLPWQVPLLKELAKSIGLPEEELVDAFIVSKYLEPAFQLCARCDIRNPDSNKPINLFVPDMKLALYIKKRYFTNASISSKYMVQNEPKPKTTTRNRNSFQRLYDMNQKERYGFMYLLRKLGRKLDMNSAEDQLIVQDWIIKQRSK